MSSLLASGPRLHQPIRLLLTGRADGAPISDLVQLLELTQWEGAKTGLCMAGFWNSSSVFFHHMILFFSLRYCLDSSSVTFFWWFQIGYVLGNVENTGAMETRSLWWVVRSSGSVLSCCICMFLLRAVTQVPSPDLQGCNLRWNLKL